jgi:hypothetical protein
MEEKNKMMWYTGILFTASERNSTSIGMYDYPVFAKMLELNRRAAARACDSLSDQRRQDRAPLTDTKHVRFGDY